MTHCVLAKSGPLGKNKAGCCVCFTLVIQFFQRQVGQVGLVRVKALCISLCAFVCSLVCIWGFLQGRYPYHVKSYCVCISGGKFYGELMRASSQGFKALMEGCGTSKLSGKSLQEVAAAQWRLQTSSFIHVVLGSTAFLPLSAQLQFASCHLQVKCTGVEAPEIYQTGHCDSLAFAKVCADILKHLHDEFSVALYYAIK